MSERVTYVILALLAGCVVAALCIAKMGDVESGSSIIRDIVIGLLGALGGYSAAKAKSSPVQNEGEGSEDVR